VDEFSSGLRFSGVGVLAMANAGPKSNGSQFFVTVAPTPGLNDKHTIFGWVTSGTNVVIAISQVAVDANDKPLTNQVIQSVTIRRVGTAAQNFNINAQTLPEVTHPTLRLTNSGAQVALTFTNRAYADNRLYTSTNLEVWSEIPLGIEMNPPGTNLFFYTKDAQRRFFRATQVQYASSTFAPRSLSGKVLRIVYSTGPVCTLTFTNSTTGTCVTPAGSGAITGSAWYQESYRGYVWPVLYSNYYPQELRLDFTSNTAGNFVGNEYRNGVPYSIGGTFTLN
jgi:hypothetical protein